MPAVVLDHLEICVSASHARGAPSPVRLAHRGKLA